MRSSGFQKFKMYLSLDSDNIGLNSYGRRAKQTTEEADHKYTIRNFIRYVASAHKQLYRPQDKKVVNILIACWAATFK